MRAVLGVGGYLAATVSAAYLVLGKHWKPAAEPHGRPWGALAPTLWRHCPRCAQDGYVLAPGGNIPPCPCLTAGDPS